MFNGIIFKTAKVKEIKKNKSSLTVKIENVLKLKNNDIGSSISCNGVCLTVEEIKDNLIFFYISIETLNRSCFKYLKINEEVNLEKSLTYGQKISGHFIQGHVDTTGSVNKISFIDKTWLIRFKLYDKSFTKYLIEKGSISINGVSLTISKISGHFFEINVIPHTLKLTNLKKLKIDKSVNLELDIFSKYMYKYSI